MQENLLRINIRRSKANILTHTYNTIIGEDGIISDKVTRHKNCESEGFRKNNSVVDILSKVKYLRIPIWSDIAIKLLFDTMYYVYVCSKSVRIFARIMLNICFLNSYFKSITILTAKIVLTLFLKRSHPLLCKWAYLSINIINIQIHFNNRHFNNGIIYHIVLSCYR